ncbi:SigE family RNA polymerase sigma factor [Modestobacter sp. I12A-02628]|uniref:SigE family RNA polymerase sigma factor n=1 Tax=Goekera deserti TaxID=2497753 RepID=A0A7K3WI48_9ACTN|nr:SigE family RNA polymerase sigma factor [Goekera deserti]MPQ96421.1 SigE family RNA polymerase sigma factor [Goekera deserti]NDI47267.1 SigE family RNA polymerase sigma factor [Goekera deserti]NEL56097.1 SigE family RNA polymerase sigma factor [Goekera deserti]
MSSDEDEAFRDFVAGQRRALLRTAYLLAGDHGHAEDLVQVALLKTHRHWARVISRGDPTAYVRRVLVTTHTSWRRRRASTEQVLETMPDQAGPAVPERDDELLHALRTLPPRMRAVVVLRFYEDLSEAQTAELMGCSVGTVKTQSSRAMARLRDLLTPAAPDRPVPTTSRKAGRP